LAQATAMIAVLARFPNVRGGKRAFRIVASTNLSGERGGKERSETFYAICLKPSGVYDAGYPIDETEFSQLQDRLVANLQGFVQGYLAAKRDVKRERTGAIEVKYVRNDNRRNPDTSLGQAAE